MAQRELTYQIKSLDDTMQLTAYAGIAPFFDLLVHCGFFKRVHSLLKLRSKGWPDLVQVLGLLTLLLANGEHVDDVVPLQRDEALMKLLHLFLARHLRGPEKKAYTLARRSGALPSPSSLRRYLEEFHDPEQEEQRAQADEKAFIPKPNPALQALSKLNAKLVDYTLCCLQLRSVTFDMDATLAESYKREALFTYKHFPGYQPLNVFLAELGQMLYSSFRDGNVPCGYRQLEVLKTSLSLLPTVVRQVSLRTDTQGYEWELLRYCAEGKDPRFGVIPFACGVDITQEFKQAVAKVDCWTPYYFEADGQRIKTNQEWAEVAFAPNAMAQGRSGTRYRFIAIREGLQHELPGMPQSELPFPSYESGPARYKLHALVSNRFDLGGEELIRWHRARCGSSEHAHSEIKNTLAGGSLPSGKFGANAAWWQFNVMAFNLHRMMAVLVLGEDFARRKLKSIRRLLINIAAWVQKKGRQLILRVAGDKATLLRDLRRRIDALPT